MNENGRFLLFTLMGGIAALANIGSRFLLNLVMPYRPAIVLAYLAGMTTAFFLFKFLVFQARSSRRTKREVMFFIGINMLALVQTYLISIALAEYFFPFCGWTFFPRDFAHIVGVIVPVFTSYIGHKYLTFNGKRADFHTKR